MFVAGCELAGPAVRGGEHRAGRASVGPHAQGTSRAPGERGLRRVGHVEDEDLGGPSRGGARRRGPLPRRHRQHARGGAAPDGEARRQAPAAHGLLRGRADRVRAAPAGHHARPRLRRDRALADPETTGRPGQDQPPRRGDFGAPAPRRRAHPGSGCPTRATRRCASWCAPARRRCRTCAPSASTSSPSCSATAGSSPAGPRGRRRTRGGFASRASSIRPSISCCGSTAGRSRTPQTRLERLTQQVAELVPRWSMAPVVAAYQALRGVAFLTAVTFVAEVGDVRRFDSPRQLMAYLGLVPSERSTGERVRRGGPDPVPDATGAAAIRGMSGHFLDRQSTAPKIGKFVNFVTVTFMWSCRVGPRSRACKKIGCLADLSLMCHPGSSIA